MHPRRRSSLPPWERRSAHPQHPTGHVRRRWPREYDGGEPGEGPPNRRYRRSFDGDRRAQAQRGVRRRSMMDNIRQNPIRHGLIGLAVAGAATPVAVNQYQQALRTDPSHERILPSMASRTHMDDGAIARVWQNMEAQREAGTAEREATINSFMQAYSEFSLSRELAEDIYDMAKEAEIEMDVAYGLVRAESSFRNTSTSRVGAIGLTQLMPATAKWLEPGVTNAELRNPETNLRIGFKYLRDLIDKYEGDVDLALTAYNRGPGTVDRLLKKGGNPDNGYAKFVKTGDVGNHEG